MNFTSVAVAERLGRVSGAPIFGLLDATLGHGSAGGSLINFEHIGAQAGQMVLKILSGTQGSDNIPAILDVPPVPMFDWRQLERFNLNASALPPDAIILNKPVSAWEHYKLYIIGALAFVMAQSFLLAGLLVQRRRKRTAVESLRQKTEELDQFFKLSLELLCIAKTDGSFLRLNPAWERSLGGLLDDQCLLVNYI